MLLRFDMTLLQFIPFIPTAFKFIKKLIGLGLVGGMVLKKFGSLLLNMPRQMLRATFKIQKEIVYFPFRMINTFYRLLFGPNNKTCNGTKTLQETSKVEASKNESHCKKSVIKLKPVMSYPKRDKANADLECDWPRHKATQVKSGLRQESPHKSKTNSCLQPKSFKTAESVTKSNRNKDIEDDDFVMPEFPNGTDFVRYSEIMTRKSLKVAEDLSNFAKSRRSPDGAPSISNFSHSEKEYLVHESNLNGIDCSFNKLLDETSVEAMISQKSRHHKEKLSAKSILTEAVPTIKKVIRELDCQEKGSDVRNTLLNSKHAKTNRSSRIISNGGATDAESALHNAQQVLNASFELLRSVIDIVTQEIISVKDTIIFVKERIVPTNGKIEELLGTSLIVFEQLSQINGRFNRLIDLINKMTDLQRELSEGYKLFQEVEADRNNMQLKLQALERMIKEEEEYLGDVSCESGYDEVEIRVTSPYKNGYL